MKNFKKLKVWEKGMGIVVMTYQITGNLPVTERFGLVSQMNRAAVSVSSNIAEGSSRDSVKDFRHFLRIALGSCFELETQLLIVERLEFLTSPIVEGGKTELDQEQKMIMSLMNKIS